MARIAVPFSPTWPKTPADRFRWRATFIVSLIFAGTAVCGITSVLLPDFTTAALLTGAGTVLGTGAVVLATVFGTIPANSYEQRPAQIRYFCNLCFAYTYAMLCLLAGMCAVGEYVPQTHLILPEVFALGCITLAALGTGLAYSGPWVD